MRYLLQLCALAAISLQLTASESQATEVNQVEELTEWKHFIFKIEDTKCRVGIASVKLSVSTLQPEGENLVGEYSIDVPLMSSQNDKGRIVLPLNDKSIADLGSKGGILQGQAISYKEGTTPNRIICEILPLKNKTILLEITTDHRTLEFKSRYTVSETAPPLTQL